MAVVGKQRLVFRGEAAVVRLGYQKAATLGAWQVVDGALSAEVVDVDGFRITQAPLMLEIPNRDGSTVRRALGAARVVGGRFVAHLMPTRREP